MDNTASVPRKPKRVPLPGQIAPRPKLEAPFREEPELFGRGEEQDRALERKLLKQLCQDAPPSASNLPGGTILTNPATTASNGETSLVTSLTSRLNQVEKTVRLQKEQLQKKDASIGELTKKNDSQQIEISRLKSETTILLKRIADMEQFLADYGLEWRGSSNSDLHLADLSRDDGDVDEDYKKWVQTLQETPAKVSEEVNTIIFGFDMGKITSNVEELNVLAGEGTSQFQESKDGSYQLKRVEPLFLSIYRNGIRINDGPFRCFQDDPTSRTFIKDLVDGYFPYELKEKYPDGVPFKVRNCANTDFEPPQKSFVGQGLKLGSPSHPAAKVWKPAASTTPTSSVKSADDSDKGKPVSRAEFLNRLPKAVVRNGEVIDVRKSVGTLLGANSHNHAGPEPVTIKTSTSDLLQEGVVVEEPICTLRIKTPDVTQIYTIQLKSTNRIADVRAAIDNQWSGSKNYQLRVAYPAKVLSDENCTLSEAGLVPNATLLMGF